jgi:hypothetical protein
MEAGDDSARCFPLLGRCYAPLHFPMVHVNQLEELVVSEVITACICVNMRMELNTRTYAGGESLAARGTCFYCHSIMSI